MVGRGRVRKRRWRHDRQVTQKHRDKRGRYVFVPLSALAYFIQHIAIIPLGIHVARSIGDCGRFTVLLCYGAIAKALRHSYDSSSLYA